MRPRSLEAAAELEGGQRARLAVLLVLARSRSASSSSRGSSGPLEPRRVLEIALEVGAAGARQIAAARSGEARARTRGAALGERSAQQLARERAASPASARALPVSRAQRRERRR